MKNVRKKTGPLLLVIFFIWLAFPVWGDAESTFLKGKVHYLDNKDLSLAKKFDLAKSEFKKLKEGNVYFTGYVYTSRQKIHSGEKWDVSK
ncbi:unnamed protein product, partial [marine sediment metagenome]